MVSTESVHQQLKKLGFKTHGWGRGEVKELAHILLPDEEILEIVNGIYEGGFALLVATDVRVVLVDQKPLNYLTVEDLRFDMINEMDYSHRLFGARISIATGNKNLIFRSYNQPRLRKLIGHVQHNMAEAKRQNNNHQVDQKQHLQSINEQLQLYLLAQQQQQMQMRLQPDAPAPPPIRPSNELSDYLFAQSLLAQYQSQAGQAADPRLQPDPVIQQIQPIAQPTPIAQAVRQEASNRQEQQTQDLYNEGLQEIFGKPAPASGNPVAAAAQSALHLLEINPMSIAYSKLPMAMRNRRFGRPSFHAHSQQEPALPLPDAQLTY